MRKSRSSLISLLCFSVSLNVVAIGVILWFYFQDRKPTPLGTPVSTEITETRIDTTVTDETAYRKNTSDSKNENPTADDFDRWNLLVAKNTELVNTMSLVFTFGTFIFVIIQLVLYFQVKEIRKETEETVSRSIKNGLIFSRYINNYTLEADMSQLRYMQELITITNEVIKPAISEKKKGKDQDIELFEKSIEAFADNIRHSRARLNLLSGNSAEILKGITELNYSVGYDPRDIEYVKFVLEWFEKNPPSEYEIDKEEMEDIMKKLYLLKRDLEKPSRNHEKA